MELKKKLQDAISIVNPQPFLKGLILFDLINVKENETLQHNIKQKQGKQLEVEILKFLIHKLHNESSIYLERFKYFLGYYEVLRTMFVNWNSLSKMFWVLIIITVIHYSILNFTTVNMTN